LISAISMSIQEGDTDMGLRIKLPFENIYDFEGAKLNYRMMGKGKPVILLHGSMVADPWFGFDERISREYQVFLPELPGFGASETIPGRVHNTELFAEAFAGFVRKTGMTRVPVIAFSMGTVVAARAAAAGSIKGTIIMAGMPIRLESPLLKRFVDLPLTARHILAQNEITRGGILLVILADVIGTADSNFAGKYLELLKTSDVRAMVDSNPIDEIEKDLPWVLQQVKNPLWFIYGEHDKLKTGADKWLGKRILVVSGAGHDVFAARPEKTMALINKLLKPRGLMFRVWQHIKLSL
jgi:pimeloyl-ACP methyl ester carboxylesterase